MPIRAATLVVLLVGVIGSAAHGATAEQVDSTIAKAKAYLYSQQKNGNWEEVQKREERDRSKPVSGQDTSSTQWGGRTALAVLALLVSGENAQDPRLVPAIDFLRKADMIGTYALGVRCQVWLKLPTTPANTNALKADVKKLIGLMKTTEPARGFYDYDSTGGPKTYSLSRAQYAVLGVWAAAQAGQEIPGKYWSDVEKAWTGAQEKDGGWKYVPTNETYPVTAGMTAVGIATLFIVQDQLYANRGIDCKNPLEMPAIEKGIDWMTKNFDQVASKTPYPREAPYATLYAVERVGVAGGLKYFGKHDWYDVGAEYIVSKQGKNGTWTGYPGALPNACFSMIFLSRGRAPVIFNKLDWVNDKKSAGGNWNRRPRDIANATRWIGRSTEREFNWQIVNLDSPIEDWHDSPILYLSGSDPLQIDKPYVEKMRQFAEDGGMIVINADCGKAGFNSSARKLVGEMFRDYEFRELPAEHPIYTTNYQRAKWKTKPSVLGLSNGVREMVILLPTADPAKTWQRGAIHGVEEGWQLAANLVFYAGDQAELRYKGNRQFIPDDAKAVTTASLKVARLQYKGNWNPEPGGWRRMRNLLRRDDKLDVAIEPVELGKGQLDGVKVAHLTGTTKLKLDDAAKAQLKKFVADGGTLIVDAAGGSEAFATSVEPDLASLGPGAKLEILPADDALFGAKDDLKIAYRAFARKTLTGKTNAPRIKAIRVGDRPAILFSREDLSTGLVGNTVGGVVGYSPGTATQLVRRMILSAADIKPAPTSQPTKSTEKPKKSGTKKKQAPAASTPESGTGLE